VETFTRLALKKVLPPAMRIQRCRAVGADDLQVFKPIVRRNPVDVVKDQRHPATTPFLTLPADFLPPH
jgi:hypothetical protein